MPKRIPPVITKLDELPALLTVLEAAGVLRTSEDSIYQRISRGQLTKREGLVRDGGRVLFLRDKFVRWIESGGSS